MNDQQIAISIFLGLYGIIAVPFAVGGIALALKWMWKVFEFFWEELD